MNMGQTKEARINTHPFWRTKRLEELSRQEWESLCDGCAKCCLVRLEDEDTGTVVTTNLSCQLLDQAACICSDYKNRTARVPGCTNLTPDRVREFTWLPASCAYRLVAAGKDLPWWHHLKSGSRDTVHDAGQSVQGQTVCETSVPEDHWEDHVTGDGET